MSEITIEGNKLYAYKYPHPSVTTDCVVFGYDTKEGLSLLLIERGLEPFKGQWALPGGFLRMDESTEQCALRELKEETNLSNPFIEEVGCFSNPNRDPRERVITIAYLALVKKSEVVGGDDAMRAEWWPINQLPQLAFDHADIVSKAIKKLKEKICFEPIGFELLPEVFTMPQLQHLYESILQVKFDRRNFASKMRKLEILTPTTHRPASTATRIPINYSFNKEKYALMKANKAFRFEF